MDSINYTRLAPPAGARIVVVGGAGGMGRSLVNASLAQGLRVAVLDLPASLARHAPPSDCLVTPLDATNESQVRDAYAQIAVAWGALDHVVNLVGFARDRYSVKDTPVQVWDEVVTGNLKSIFLSCRTALPLLRNGTGASIVNIASGLATRSMPGFGPYSSAKAGVLALTRTLALENAPHIRVNSVAPNAVDTAFLRGGTGRIENENQPPTHLDVDAYVRNIPLGRLAQPEDIIGPILFLLGDAARYMTGQTLYVNGGMLMQ